MVIRLTWEQVRGLRLRAQRLDQPAAASVAEVVQAVGGVQAQAPLAAALSVRPRCAGVTAAQVEGARVEARSIVRTWLMRGTLHLVASDDLPWLLPLFGPLFSAASRRRRLELGLEDDTVQQGVAALRNALADGPLTRDQITQRMAERGIELVGQARPHLIAYAAQQGIVCCGPDQGSEPTYVLLTDWLGYQPHPAPETMLPELVRRYLAAFGPTRPEDMAGWSGLPMREVRAAWAEVADEMLEVAVEDEPFWLLKRDADRLDGLDSGPSPVRLLAAFDTLLLGYRDRQWLHPTKSEQRIKGGGILPPALLVKGRVAGVWRVERGRNRVTVEVTPFETLDPDLEPALAAEAADVGRFYGVEAQVEIRK
ncbi:MAG: AlkZ family DNA glycosylase [Anaerolineae bacterium]|nr:AlkZ family DNA glycosylase [Anaerolineae bacterium]